VERQSRDRGSHAGAAVSVDGRRFPALLMSCAALFAAVSQPVQAQAQLPAGVAQGNGQAVPGPRSAARPRNVVFILLDDLRFDGMGFLQPALKTPNIDKLARGGTYFPNAVVNSSLCSPSRATILTGQTPRNHRIVDNNDKSPDGRSERDLTFFPSYLQQAGYQTAFVGKWHIGASNDKPRPGFDKWVSFKGQGSYVPSAGRPNANGRPGGATTLDVDGNDVPQKGYITDELTDYAIDWLSDERDKSKPFFLYLSHKAVHSGATPPPRYAHQYDNVNFTLPDTAANTPENYRGKPLWVYNQRNSWHGVDYPYNSEQDMADYLRQYYATLSAVDDSVGRILDYLKKNGLEKDTLVVFTSDNGYMIGDHGLIDKRAAYEASVRVPLVVYGPGFVPAGRTNPARIRNLDYAPTFLALANVAAPKQFEGQNVLPVITGQVRPENWKAQDFIYEYYWEWSFPSTPTTFAITRDNLKYIQYHGVYDLDELYDLSKDPTEKVNLTDDPAYQDRKATLRTALFDQLINAAGRWDIPYTARDSIGSVRRVRQGTGAAPFPDSWLIEARKRGQPGALVGPAGQGGAPAPGTAANPRD
jgi:arylsulfatase A-like enzyme